jgi:integrase
MTLGEFLERHWRSEVAIGLKPTTLCGYEKDLQVHVLPDFGDYPLPAVTRAAVKAFIARKSKQQRASRSLRNPNPNRPALSPKSIRNMVATLSAVLESAVVDYELLPSNALWGVLRRKNFPTDARRPKDERPRVLEPDDFKHAMEQLHPPVLQMALVAALAGLRWGEQVSLRIDEDVDLRRNKLRITRALYKRIPQTLKAKQSLRDVDMGPIVRRIMRSVPWTEGLVFSPDGAAPIGEGSWIKRQWRKAQVRAGIRRPIRWHDLRHQFVSLLIAAGKSPKYIAEQAGHASAGFTLDRYGHLFETITPTPGEWPEDLLWPSGSEGVVGRIWHHIDTVLATKSRSTAGEHTFPSSSQSQVNQGAQE